MAADRTMIEKLKKVIDALEKMGKLKMFALVWRENLKRWDVLVSAKWVDSRKIDENVGDIFDALKSQFNGEFAFRFSGIYPLATTEPFVVQLTQLLDVDEGGDVELENCQINNVNIERMVLLVSRKEVEISPSVVSEAPIEKKV
jgi:hypothetical protein